MSVSPNVGTNRVSGWTGVVAVVAVPLLLTGCGLDPATRNTLGGLAVGYAGVTPTSNLEQVYYLGVFDPQEQLPPTVYRVRVRGQGSALNFTRYASGWVRAELIDSLSTVAKFDSKELDSGVKVTPSEPETKLLTGRRLVMFGPEGFREAPKDHRLVVVMGSSPEKFFQAVDQALGNVAAATQGTGGQDLERGLFREILRLKSERERLDDLRADVKAGA